MISPKEIYSRGGKMQNLDALIECYRNEGLSFIPIPYKSKVPAIEWKQFQQTRPDDDHIKTWFTGHDTNLAVICGSVSGGLVVLDFDSENGFWEFDGVCSAKTGIELFDFTRVSKTARGFHVWLRVQEPVKNQKYPKLDIKSDGGYVIAPPSVHPDGTAYEFLNSAIPIRIIQSLSEISIDVTAKPETNRETSHNEPDWVTQALLGVADGSRGDTAIKLAGYFRNLKPGSHLVARYHKQSYSCEVVEGEGGKLRYRLADGRDFKSPSAAGKAITGHACDGWVFWSVETAPSPQPTENSSVETQKTMPTAKTTLGEGGQPDEVKKGFFRTPNQKGVPEGQTRWYCHDCGKSFLAATGQTPQGCPAGHQAS
jgi:hypothetical protein